MNRALGTQEPFPGLCRAEAVSLWTLGEGMG